MSSTINATTVGVGGVVTTADNSGILVLQTASTTALTISAAQGVTLASTLGVTGATTLSTTLGVTGATTLSSTLGVTGATTLSSTLGVTGATTLSSTLGVTGATTLSTGLTVTGGRSQLAANSETFALGVKYSAAGGSYYFGAASASATPDGVFSQAGGSERMRITDAGNLFLGSSTTLGSTARFEITGQTDVISLRYVSAGAGTYVRFICNSNNDFYISNAGFTQYVYKDYNSNTWGSSSDERLKDIIEPITDGLNKVLKLRSVIGKFKTDEDGKRRSFLIAQDVLEVLPEAVQLTNNPVVNREEYVLYYSDVIPLLVSAIKDLKTITEAQAIRITALETL